MQRNLNTLGRTCRLLRWGSLIVALLAMTACGPLGDDDTDSTATAEVISQPTSPELETTTETPAGDGVTPDSGVATPGVFAATPADAQATPNEPFDVIAGTPVSEEAPGVDLSTPVTSAGDTGFVGSDGTSGATPDIEGGDTGVQTPPPDEEPSSENASGTPSGDPFFVPEVATPAAGATPDSIPLAELEPIAVTGCDPGTIPPYSGAQVNFLTNADVNFRTGPGADCETIGDGPIGTNIPVTVLGGPVIREDADDQFIWVQAQILDETGWVVIEVLDPAP